MKHELKVIYFWTEVVPDRGGGCASFFHRAGSWRGPTRETTEEAEDDMAGHGDPLPADLSMMFPMNRYERMNVLVAFKFVLVAISLL